MSDHSPKAIAEYPDPPAHADLPSWSDYPTDVRAAFDKGQAAGWDEACMAFGWALDNGPTESAAAYVAANNPHRPASTTGSEQP